jgi:hypothetical protein
MDAAGVTALVFVVVMLIGTPIFFTAVSILAARRTSPEA